MKALLIIDIQKDFLPGGALAVTEGDQIVPYVNSIIPGYEQVVATQDWHPENHGSFAANHEGGEVGTLRDLHGLEQILWPVHCVQDTDGAAFADGLTVEQIDTVVYKGEDPTVDSYSGFFDNGRRNKTELDEILKAKGVTALDVVGLATDYCVTFTVLDALDLGYEVRLLTEGCRGVNLQPGDVDRAIEEMRAAGAEII